MYEALINEAVELFRRQYDAAPEAIGIAPGRVEVLGNHTDYNGGYVLAVALNRAVAVAGAPALDDRIEMASGPRGEVVRAHVGRWERNERAAWTHYPIGVLKELAEAGAPIGGMRMAVTSTVPVGSGLSSSAALELAAAHAALRLYPHPFEKMELALLCQRAENRFVGVNCGLLDQFSSSYGEENAALFLDCLTLENRVAPLGDAQLSIVVANSMTPHRLVSGEYNRLRRECMEAAAALGRALGRPVKLLREVSLEEFEQHAAALPENLRKRARHVLTENQRVLDGVAALERGDLAKFGETIFASHASSRDDFGNSVEGLDCLVELAQSAPGAIGAKLSGGGFGGATVNLVRRDHAEAFMAHLAEGFENRIGKRPDILLCGIGRGAHGASL